MEHVILVDKYDNEIGSSRKMEAHRSGNLHRAYSIVLFNSKGELLLQQRADTKYHSGGLWTNSCCSHPKPGEVTRESAIRRLQEEMGINCDLRYIFKFIYNTDLNNQLIEHELDHVFFGEYDGIPTINPAEAKGWKYMSMNDLVRDIQLQPKSYTYWFKKMLTKPEFTQAVRSI